MVVGQSESLFFLTQGITVHGQPREQQQNSSPELADSIQYKSSE